MTTMDIPWLFISMSLVLLRPGQSQIQNVPGTSQTTFYLDNSGDCDGRIREVGMSTVNIYGVNANPQGSGATSCTLTLNTENIREPHKFKIQFLAVRISEPGVYLYVYDGEYNGRLKWAFSSSNQKPSNLDFDFSTGQLVTFRMTRGEKEFNFDIRIVVTPVPSDVARCTYENEYGCDEYGYNYRLLGTKEIIGIVGGCFLLVILIVVVVVICCYRKQQGISKKWTETKLGHASLPTKRPLPPPSYVSTNTRLASSRGRRSRFDRDIDKYSDQSFSDRSVSEKNFSEKGYSEKKYRPPTYREAMRHNDSDMSADENSFVQANDDHPQKVFVERVLTARVKTKKHTSPVLHRAPPPPEEDVTYDSIDPKMREKLLSKGTEIDDEESESDNESDTTEEEESEEEEEEASEEENEETEDHPDKVEYSTPHKNKKSKPTKQPQPQRHKGAFVPLPQSQPPQQFPGGQYPGYPPQGIHQPQPRYGYPPQGQPFAQGQPAFQPQAQPFSQQPPPQPYRHPYHQANFSVPLSSQPGQGPPMMNTQPNFHGNQGHQPNREQSHMPKRDQSNMQTGNIPVYSYLVNRGYQPMEGRHSPVSTSTGATNLSSDRNVLGEDSDYSANIGAGVEVLRRK